MYMHATAEYLCYLEHLSSEDPEIGEKDLRKDVNTGNEDAVSGLDECSRSTLVEPQSQASFLVLQSSDNSAEWGEGQVTVSWRACYARSECNLRRSELVALFAPLHL